MGIIHRGRVGRKPTGGRYKQARGRRSFETGSVPTATRIGPEKKKVQKTKGAGAKTRLVLADKANLYDPKTKKFSRATITIETANPANRHFVRRNVLTKGAIVETDKGKARITNRPGQEGAINAVLLA